MSVRAFTNRAFIPKGTANAVSVFDLRYRQRRHLLVISRGENKLWVIDGKNGSMMNDLKGVGSDFSG